MFHEHFFKQNILVEDHHLQKKKYLNVQVIQTYWKHVQSISKNIF